MFIFPQNNSVLLCDQFLDFLLTSLRSLDTSSCVLHSLCEMDCLDTSLSATPAALTGALNPFYPSLVKSIRILNLGESVYYHSHCLHLLILRITCEFCTYPTLVTFTGQLTANLSSNPTENH